jgi:hypothetical protein
LALLDEVGSMQWSEIDPENRSWIIPSTRTKNHRDHILPLAGTPNMPQRSVFRRMRCAYGAIAWKKPATKWTDDPASSECPGSIKQRC